MKAILFTILLSMVSNSLFAWGQNGHRIVAQICYDNLSDEVKKQVDDILVDDYLAQVATWPDFIRSDKKWNFTQPWHYATIDPNKTVAEIIEKGKKNPKIENVIEAIEFMKAILAKDAAATKQFTDLMDSNKVKPMSGSVVATALAFLVHFIGDIHQPMHVGKNRDYGGNKIKVLFFDERTNLHSVWDEGIITKEELSFTDFADFVDKHTAPKSAAWQKSGIQNWAEESVAAREEIYNTLYDSTDLESGLPSMSYPYQHDFLPVVEDRLGAAGYRAAAVINSILK